MISLIERAEASPTAVVLDKLATGLRVPLASHFDPAHAAALPVSRADEQVAWRDPAQQIWLLEGSIEVTVGTERHRLHRGAMLGGG